MRICEECGSDGSDGMVEFFDGKLCHLRKIPDDGRAHLMWCSGEFVEREAAPEEETP